MTTPATPESAEIDHRADHAARERIRRRLAMVRRPSPSGDLLAGPEIGVGWTIALAEEVQRMLAEQEEYHLTMHRAYRPEVVAEVAVYLGEHDSWDRLVEWCGGRIVTSQDPSGEYTSTLVLPNGEAGSEWSWLVLDHSGEFHIRAEVQAPDVLTRPGVESDHG